MHYGSFKNWGHHVNLCASCTRVHRKGIKIYFWFWTFWTFSELLSAIDTKNISQWPKTLILDVWIEAYMRRRVSHTATSRRVTWRVGRPHEVLSVSRVSVTSVSVTLLSVTQMSATPILVIFCDCVVGDTVVSDFSASNMILVCRLRANYFKDPLAVLQNTCNVL